MCGQARDAHIFVFAVFEVARFQDEQFPNVMLTRVVVIDTRLVRGNVWAAINFALEYRPVIDLVNFQHVGFKRFFVSEGHGAGRFVARDTRQAFLETAADKLVVHSTSMLVVVVLHGRREAAADDVACEEDRLLRRANNHIFGSGTAALRKSGWQIWRR